MQDGKKKKRPEEGDMEKLTPWYHATAFTKRRVSAQQLGVRKVRLTKR